MPRLMLSQAAQALAADRIKETLAGQAVELLDFPDRVPDSAELAPQVDIVLLSRDVTGSSSKTQFSSAMQAFHDVVRKSAKLSWVHTHTAGADRPIYPELRARGVQVSTSSGANSDVVAQTALAGILALARKFPRSFLGQLKSEWRSLPVAEFPPDIAGQRAVIIGMGPIGQHIAKLLNVLGMRITGVRHSPGDLDYCERCVQYDALDGVLGDADWIIMACPLTAFTRHILNASRLARLNPQARIVNIARGEVIDEAALIQALQSGKLGGAYLDVFEHEPLAAQSPLWTMDNVLITPHLAGHSSGNFARVIDVFIDNLARWRDRAPLRNAVP